MYPRRFGLEVRVCKGRTYHKTCWEVGYTIRILGYHGAKRMLTYCDTMSESAMCGATHRRQNKKLPRGWGGEKEGVDNDSGKLLAITLTGERHKCRGCAWGIPEGVPLGACPLPGKLKGRA
jgi:hypothetical protein